MTPTKTKQNNKSQTHLISEQSRPHLQVTASNYIINNAQFEIRNNLKQKNKNNAQLGKLTDVILCTQIRFDSR